MVKKLKSFQIIGEEAGNRFEEISEHKKENILTFRWVLRRGGLRVVVDTCCHLHITVFGDRFSLRPTG